MEKHFYGGIVADLAVPESQKFWLLPSTMDRVLAALEQAPVHVTIGGWGPDGHIAYNQARRHPFSHLTLDDEANSTVRIQENNHDTVLAWPKEPLGLLTSSSRRCPCRWAFVSAYPQNVSA